MQWMAPVTCSSSFCDLSFVPYRSEHRTLDSRLFTKVSRSWIACVSPVRLGLENRSGNTVAGQRSEETWSNNSAKKKVKILLRTPNYWRSLHCIWMHQKARKRYLTESFQEIWGPIHTFSIVFIRTRIFSIRLGLPCTLLQRQTLRKRF